MKSVVLVGTSHSFQKAGCRGAAEFEQFARQAAADHGIVAIAEEMSPEALIESDGQPTSICQSIAMGMKLHHRFCDPNAKVREAAGIVGIQTIQINGWQHHDGQDGEWARKEIRASHDKREGIWLQRIEALDEWPMLFVCGAKHVKPFQKKLKKAGMKVTVLVEDWELPVNISE